MAGIRFSVVKLSAEEKSGAAPTWVRKFCWGS